MDEGVPKLHLAPDRRAIAGQDLHDKTSRPARDVDGLWMEILADLEHGAFLVGVKNSNLTPGHGLHILRNGQRGPQHPATGRQVPRKAAGATEPKRTQVQRPRAW